MVFRRRSSERGHEKIERFEGWWQPEIASPFSEVGGKIEWDSFADGNSEIELFAVIPELPDGSEVVVTWGDTEVMRVVSRRGVIKSDLESKDGDQVPRLAYEQVELRHQGAVIARTRLEVD